MAYTITQKIGKHFYLYEATSYWDKDKKQARQKRRYIGKKDIVTGETITPRKKPQAKSVQDYGHVYLVKSLAKRIGLVDCIKDVFPDMEEEILYLVLYQVLESAPFYLQKSWAEGAFIPGNGAISSQKISKIMEWLGNDVDSKFSFFENWTKRQKDLRGVWMDITSFSTYSDNIDFAEWGYNRDRESLPQINLGLLLGTPNNLPLFYQTYPGSITDVVTLKNVIKTSKGLGIDLNTLVIDRGFYSKSNLNELTANRLKFVVPLPSTVDEAKNLFAKSKSYLTPLKSFRQRKSIIFYWATNIKLGEIKLQAYVYLDERRRAHDLETVMKRLHDIEDVVRDMTFEKIENVLVYIENNWRGYSKFYSVKINESGKAFLTRKKAALSAHIEKLGKMILCTNSENLGHEEALKLYRQRDNIEKIFDTVKNDLHEHRLRTKSNATTEGKIFITFLSVILHSALLQLMRPKLVEKFTVAEVFMELKKIRAVIINGKNPFLTEISKKQRYIFNELKIPIPVVPSY